MTVEMVASQKFVYAGRRLSPGDRFNADNERDAKALELVRRATRAPAEPRSGRYRTRAMKAED